MPEHVLLCQKLFSMQDDNVCENLTSVSFEIHNQEHQQKLMKQQILTKTQTKSIFFISHWTQFSNLRKICLLQTHEINCQSTDEGYLNA